MRAGVIKTRFERDGGFENAFHLADQLERAECACPRQLAEIQPEIIMTSAQLWMDANGPARGLNPLLCDFSAS